MKKLLIINSVFVFVFLICWWTFALCTHGAIVHPIGFIAGPICGFISIFLFPMALVLFVIDIYYVFRFWCESKLIAFLPFLFIAAIAIGSGFLGPFINGKPLSIKRFEKYEQDYETFAKKTLAEHKKGERECLQLPREYKHLANFVTVYDDEANNIFVDFNVGYFGVFGHTSLLYSLNGDITPKSYTDRDWPRKYRINEHWFKVSD